MLDNTSLPHLNLKILLEHGFALVPIPYGEKGPRSDGWNVLENCITKASQVHLLNKQNVGLAHAYCTPNPTCAIDIDNYKTAKPWLASHGVNLDVLIHAPDSVVIRSGKVNSLKILYRLPLGTQPLVTKKINGSDDKSAIEFRCASKNGRTVQDVLPPSLHPEGYQYQWVGNGKPSTPMPMAIGIRVNTETARKTGKAPTPLPTALGMRVNSGKTRQTGKAPTPMPTAIGIRVNSETTSSTGKACTLRLTALAKKAFLKMGNLFVMQKSTYRLTDSKWTKNINRI